MNQTRRRDVLKAMASLPLANLGLGMSGMNAVHAAERPLLPGPSFFVRGAYQQPVEKMAHWKALGVNTIFTMNRGADRAEWSKVAAKYGLYMVREPAGVDGDYVLTDAAAFEKDIANPYFLAVAMIDEPSNLKEGGQGITYEDVSVTPAQVDTVARVLSRGGKPLWMNHVGNHVTNIYLEKIMSDYADSPYIDWLAHDCYPIATGNDLVIDIDDYASTQQGHAIDRLLRWSGGRPQFSFIALTKYDASSPGRKTTPAEFRAQAWSSIIHGAVGIIYFPFMFSPEFSYDATPEDLQKELLAFHSEIDEIEDILVDKVKGGRRSYTLIKSIRTKEKQPDGTLPFPFEASAIPTSSGEYKIIQNLSPEPAELTYEAWGLDGVKFQPYECKRGFTVADLTKS
ncbi:MULTISPECIES: hypothetical protein [unclassified Rhizobium]|uniref:hypothetical protein n=1 Tax=unclassified Rhizobium TaxID=2613769 RepID=UPI001ADAE35E|nr:MULTISPECIES: hypothetical protein [unclassified Rhizobium]MBO9127508.1 hypothetical protein [Rhizobium sp. 16-488-2b]MBO9177951.1 hypothetical protein [Rhizobium sp. 16-488-2a]